MIHKSLSRGVAGSVATLSLLAACGGGGDDALPQLAPATSGTLTSCTDLASRFSFANTTITAANAIAAGTLTVAGTPVGAHCQVTGTMYTRTSAVDGKTYAIGFRIHSQCPFIQTSSASSGSRCASNSASPCSMTEITVAVTTPRKSSSLLAK